MKALMEAIVRNSGKRSGCLDVAGLTFGTSTSAFPLILCCRNRVILYWKSRVTAKVPIELLCSIVLVGGNWINKGLEGLDDSAKSAGNLVGGLMWMRDRSGEWFCLEPLRRMIARTISKASTNRTNNWPANQTNQPIKATINQLRPTNRVTENDGLARPGNFGKSRNQSRSDWLNDYDYRQYCRWYRMRSRVGQRSRSGARDLEPARGQEQTAKALKIQEVQKVDIKR